MTEKQRAGFGGKATSQRAAVGSQTRARRPVQFSIRGANSEKAAVVTKRTRMTRAFHIGFTPRSPVATHRTSTPQELIFDLASVIAIAAAAHGLWHAVQKAHIVPGIIGFLSSFFMIWLAWLTDMWVALAYDDGSPAFRILTIFIMFGALMRAAGIGAVFHHQRIWLALSGWLLLVIAGLILLIGLTMPMAMEFIAMLLVATALTRCRLNRK